MPQIPILEALGALFLGVVVAIALLIFWIRSNRITTVTSRTLMQEAEGSITFLFDDENLVDLTPRARALMNQGNDQKSDWENFLTILSARFPNLRSQCSDLASTGRKTISPTDGQRGWIDAEYWNGLARITLVQHEGDPKEALDPLTAMAMEHELETLRAIGEESPQLIWKRDAEGILVWANRAYIEMSEAIHLNHHDDVLPWPPYNVFENIAVPMGPAPIVDMHRIDVPSQNKPIWYEITSLKRGTDTIHFAVDASAVVYSQDAQRNFVQTLTKTFAQLSVGLAIFDAERRLVLFNPALTDLTNLPADFLIGRPTLLSVLDRLRDQKMIPEPKNYTSWRDQMMALETAALEGSYHENWELPNGATFRVTGKPHPNGAIAFLIEDISDEISLNRKFRSQIETTTAVLENLVSSVAVFSASGNLILANKSYRELWGAPPDGSLSCRNFLDELHTWQTSSAPSPIWIKLKETLSVGQTGSAWTGSVWLDGQVEIQCHYSPLPEGNHQVTFTPNTDDSPRMSEVSEIEIKAG